MDYALCKKKTLLDYSVGPTSRFVQSENSMFIGQNRHLYWVHQQYLVCLNQAILRTWFAFRILAERAFNFAVSLTEICIITYI